MNRTLPMKELAALGFLMFALFLGAGNLIFPPLLGQEAGTSLWPAIIGFLVTGVGLPLLAIIAVSQVNGDLHQLANRVHPVFAIIFSFTVYLAIGPFFGIPRTGTVAYEIGVVPFLANGQTTTSLLLSTLIFFSLTFLLALNPAKLVDRIGKFLTPLLIILIAIVSLRGIFAPMGSFEPAEIKYENGAFFSGFIEGYLTMDTIAALVFGIVIMNRLAEKGVKDRAAIQSFTIKAGLIAGVGLSLVYLSLGYLGASSVSTIGRLDNGGAILASVANVLFGSTGSIILALVITFACLTTSIGLVSACGEFFAKRFTSVSYPVIIFILCVFSFTMANLGLSQLIAVSLPVLVAIYPIAIVLITLSFFHKIIGERRSIYVGALIGAGLISLLDGITTAGVNLESITFLQWIPLHAEGLGWLIPSIIGGLIGWALSKR
ncbi:branched-chain amino acid transport system II carrier protein [Alkalihalophilus lindianensis]|uniref:Branched-chain amino acid transport system carrier protein n=1 Tax=Alkalihalophilus lindianensis TaxID=1630542 RepID=A0ABU3XAV3_9BACI|nr:branched-chain amino acid transport system II carrier protein [Alkalihalophilus lindianensis]MDV2684752.1 branched-chain amino acid transport system II carrier protein [Alkalihalophilus lindianensis]